MTTPMTTPALAPASRVLLVDDEPDMLGALRRSLAGRGFEISTAASGDEALALMQRQPVDAIVCDLRMPGMSGVQLLEQSVALAPAAVRVLMRGQADAESARLAGNGGRTFRCLAKPWDDEILHQLLDDALARSSLERDRQRLLALTDALTRRSLERDRELLLALTEQQRELLQRLDVRLGEHVAQRTAELAATVTELRQLTLRLKGDFSSAVRLLSSLLESRAGLTARCPSLVAGHVLALGGRMGLAADGLHDLTFAALLQDLGKLALPDALVRQPLEALALDARARLLRHPQVGEISLMALPSLRGAGMLLGRINENFDGSGVPGELRGDAIPLGARILRVATDYEHYLAGAIETAPLTPAQACRRIRQFRGTRYDPAVVDAFLGVVDRPLAARRALVAREGLRPGMQLAHDLFSAAGSLLLAQGCVLDAAVIAQIRGLDEFAGESFCVVVGADDGCEVRVRTA